MSSLIKIKETMTSLELVDLINRFRKLEGETAVLRHNNFKASILKEFEGMLPKKHTYINSQNKQEYEYFELDFYQVIQLLMKESIKVRQEVIEDEATHSRDFSHELVATYIKWRIRLMKKIYKMRVEIVPNIYGSCIVYKPYLKLLLE